MRLPLAALLLSLAACAPDGAEPANPAPVALRGSFTFVDDGAANPGFSMFRDTLRAVAARRDTAALMALVGPSARLSFGDDPGGPEGVRRLWFEQTPPEGRALWDVLTHVLDGGSVEEDGAVVAPAAAGTWPEDLDPFETVAVVGEAVSAYGAPGGEVIATITTMALPRLGPPEGGWQPVALPDGRRAVLAEATVYSPTGYRLTAWDDGDGWKLRTLLSGD